MGTVFAIREGKRFPLSWQGLGEGWRGPWIEDVRGKVPLSEGQSLGERGKRGEVGNSLENTRWERKGSVMEFGLSPTRVGRARESVLRGIKGVFIHPLGRVEKL